MRELKDIDPYIELEDSVVRTLVDCFKLLNITCEVIIAHENGVEPKKDYASVTVLDLTPSGQASFDSGIVSWDKENKKAYQYSSRVYTPLVQIDFIGKNSSSNALIYFNSLSGNTRVQEIFQKNNISSLSYTRLRRNPQLRGTRWVNTFVYDHTLSFSLSTRQETDWVDSVDIEANPDDFNN